jgi:hypothetical protein
MQSYPQTHICTVSFPHSFYSLIPLPIFTQSAVSFQHSFLHSLIPTFIFMQSHSFTHLYTVSFCWDNVWVEVQQISGPDRIRVSDFRSLECLISMSTEVISHADICMRCSIDQRHLLYQRTIFLLFSSTGRYPIYVTNPGSPLLTKADLVTSCASSTWPVMWLVTWLLDP